MHAKSSEFITSLSVSVLILPGRCRVALRFSSNNSDSIKAVHT